MNNEFGGSSAPTATEGLLYIERGQQKMLGPSTDGYTLTLSGGVPAWLDSSTLGDMTLSGIQTVTGAKTFNSGKLILGGATSGTTIFNANATAGTTTITLPATTGTLIVNPMTTAGDILVGGTSGDVFFEGYSPNIYSDTGDLLLAFNGVIASGNVAIGQGAADTRLDVDGTTTSTAIRSATYQDSFGDTMLTFSHTASAINYFNMVNAPISNNPIFEAVGADANVGFVFSTKGTGTFNFEAASTTPFNISSGTSLQHSATFLFNSSASSQNITFQSQRYRLL